MTTNQMTKLNFLHRFFSLNISRTNTNLVTTPNYGYRNLGGPFLSHDVDDRYYEYYKKSTFNKIKHTPKKKKTVLNKIDDFRVILCCEKIKSLAQ